MFHSTCDAETEYIRQQFSRALRVVQIPNYVEIPDLVEREPSNYLLYIGRIHPKKAIDSLIKSLARSREFLNSSFVLKIAGTGERSYEEHLERLAQDLGITKKIEFIGHVEGEAKQKLYANAYWTFMPSHTENFGMVVLESLAQNTPVLASKESPWEDLEQEHIGFWVNNSPKSMAEQIDKIIKMPKESYECYRKRGRVYVTDKFHIVPNVHVWREFYASL